MKLSKINITHFRCFESIEVVWQPDINVIVGANGAGKSSMLDALAIALYELVAANGAGSQRQRKAQNAALLPSDIHMISNANYELTGESNARRGGSSQGYSTLRTHERASCKTPPARFAAPQHSPSGNDLSGTRGLGARAANLMA